MVSPLLNAALLPRKLGRCLRKLGWAPVSDNMVDGTFLNNWNALELQKSFLWFQWRQWVHLFPCGGPVRQSSECVQWEFIDSQLPGVQTLARAGYDTRKRNKIVFRAMALGDGCRVSSCWAESGLVSEMDGL